MQRWQKEFEQFRIATEDYLRATVGEMLYQPIPPLSMEKFALFQKTGNRLLYEQEYFAKRKFLTIFGVAAQRPEFFGEDSRHKVYRKLEAILLSVCEEETWALPAHVNPADVNWRYTIDLFAAETAQALMDIIDATEDNLSIECVLKVREQVQKRVLEPFFRSEQGAYGWESCDNNWNAVCNGCIGSAYLHSLLGGEEPDWKNIRRICDNLKHYIDGFAEDGTCMEGLGYYFYGMSYFVNFAQELFILSKGTMDLLDKTDNKCARIAEWWGKCYFDSGITVSFSDGSSREKYRVGLGCILAQQFPNVTLPPVKMATVFEEDSCYRYLPFKQDVFATFEYQSVCKNVTGNRVYILPSAQWSVAQIYKKNPEKGEMTSVGFACKGGHNGEAHNHNDAGSFLYAVGDTLYLTDLGAGEYTMEYFSDGRYEILCNRSMGHNVPLLSGLEQMAGAEYGCDNFEAEENEKTLMVSMDLKRAYGQRCLQSYNRNIVFGKEDGTCVVSDSFETTEELTVTENLVTQIVPKLRGNEVLLEGNGTVCRIQIKPALTPEIITKEHSNHQGEKEQVYLIQWNVFVENKAQVEIHISV